MEATSNKARASRQTGAVAVVRVIDLMLVLLMLTIIRRKYHECSNQLLNLTPAIHPNGGF